MLDFIEKIANSILDDYNEKRWIKAFLKLIGCVLILVCMGLILAKLMLLIIYNIKNIVITIGSLACFFAILISFFPKKQSEPIKPETSIMAYNQITLESTYNLIRKNLCSILCDISDMARLRKPATLSQMDSPTHFDISGDVVIYHFLAIKLSNDVDTYNILGIIQNALEQRLNAHEFDGLSQTHFFYRSQVYPSLMVDNVRDLGSYIQIDIAITSESYCKYREQRIYSSINPLGSNHLTDKDF